MESTEKNIFALRRRLAALDSSRRVGHGNFSLGMSSIDRLIGGLPRGALHAPGLLELGARPENILLVDAHDPAAVLRVASKTASAIRYAE